jgi:hypothetical protein
LTGVVLRADGRLAASGETIEKLRRLVAEDEAAIHLDRPEDRPTSTQPVGDDIEATLVQLIGETATAATKAFRMADQEAHPGGSVETFAVCVGQGSRAAAACAQLAEALTTRRDKGKRFVLEYVHIHKSVVVASAP